MLASRLATRRCGKRLLIAVIFVLAGCAVGPDPDYRLEMSQLAYPEAAPYGDDVDMVVTRHGWMIDLTNRTPHAHDDIQLWLNRQYVRKILRINIGAGHTYHLNEFVNQYEEGFPPGGFLRPEKGMPVVLAELYNPQTQMKNRLIVQP